MNELKHITEVCKMFGMTSRTIRYYEQCGLIRTVRTGKTAPRRLDSENIERLRHIRFLRRLGLSLEEIAEVIDSEEKATALIYDKTAALKAEIHVLAERISLLKEVLAAAEQGEHIYAAESRLIQTQDDPEKLRIAALCTKLILEQRFEDLMPHLDSDMRMMPPGFFQVGWNVHIKPCGAFLGMGKQTVEDDAIVNRIRFEKTDVAILMEVHAGLVTDMFLRYCREDESSTGYREESL